VNGYKIRVHRRVERALEELPVYVSDRVSELIDELGRDPVPRSFDVEKIRGMADTYRVRIGDYRVLYSVDQRGREITVFKVAARGKAYGSDSSGSTPGAQL
jgi:mRNA interferase RelE/StbE